jgi:DNA-dependent protein kinase catalytic subunit
MGLVGSGGELVHFLVKGGEDLRNDQRVEELFVLMNRIVREEKEAGGEREGLRARSFSVIPMTPRVGLLEWVADTVPLKAVLTSEMQRDAHFVSQNPHFLTRGGDGELQFLRASEERAAWLKDSSYHKMFRSAKSEQAEKLYRKLNNLVPDHFLRRRWVGGVVGPLSSPCRALLVCCFSSSLSLSYIHIPYTHT